MRLSWNGFSPVSESEISGDINFSSCQQLQLDPFEQNLTGGSLVAKQKANGDFLQIKFDMYVAHRNWVTSRRLCHDVKLTLDIICASYNW